jgi:hypothetical protein
MANPERRPPFPIPEAGTPPIEVIYARLRKLAEYINDNHIGIPGGWFDIVPTTIAPDDAADPGEETQGWAAANHKHAIATATPSDLGESLAEGTATSFARSDHIHKLLTRVSKSNAVTGTRKRINFLDGNGIFITTTDDSGSDQVSVRVAATGQYPAATKTADYTLATDDYIIFADPSATSSFTLTLPSAVANIGRVYFIGKVDNSANTVTIDGNGGDLIDGATTRVLTGQYEWALLACNGTGWYTMATTNAPSWREYTVSHTALQTAAMANDIELFSLPAAGIIHAVKTKHSVQFAGTGITDYKLSVGIVGTLAKYSAAWDVDTAVAGTNFQLSSTVGSEDHGAATSIRLAATTTGANLDQSTAGTVTVWVLVSLAT